MKNNIEFIAAHNRILTDAIQRQPDFGVLYARIRCDVPDPRNKTQATLGRDLTLAMVNTLTADHLINVYSNPQNKDSYVFVGLTMPSGASDKIAFSDTIPDGSEPITLWRNSGAMFCTGHMQPQTV